MKKLKLITLASTLTLTTLAQANTVSIRADNWYPMNGAPGAAKEGFMIDIAREVFGKAGYTVNYKLMPWERAIKSTREGKVDCVVGAYKEDAPDFNYPKENWGMDVTGYFVQSNSVWSFSGFDSLLDQKVGVIEGYAYGEEFDNLVATRKDVFKSVKGNSALEKNFKKLVAGRLDVVVESVNVGSAKLKEIKMDKKIKLGGQNSSADPIYIACSPASAKGKELVNIVDKGTKELRVSGKLAEIMSKYGLSDWK